MKSVIVGTAGHIDHGKTALVKALTGIDADRLEEEKRRGITIDIGFAHTELPSVLPAGDGVQGGEAIRLSFIDVPGHERFVRNMLAGIGGIDLVMLVIAADESIMPQTREHFDICRMLNIGRGLTVLTKADLVDGNTLEVVRLEVEDFLRGSFLEAAPMVTVSSRTGHGVEELKNELVRLAAAVPTRDARASFRLPIDRVFTMKGFGTVVTGTLLAGSVAKEAELEVFPAGERVRVRGMQVHSQASDEARAGQRVALNLAGAATGNLSRGMTLMSVGRFRTASRAGAQITLLPGAHPLRDRTRVHFHAYTAEMMAEVVLLGIIETRRAETSSNGFAVTPEPSLSQESPTAEARNWGKVLSHRPAELRPGQSAWVQLRLAKPLLLLPGDRFILRQFSPVVTIGGGVVVDNAPPPLRLGWRDEVGAYIAHLDHFASRSRPDQLAARVQRRGLQGLTLPDAIAETGWTPEELHEVAKNLAIPVSSLPGAGTSARTPDDRPDSKPEIHSLLRFGDILIENALFVEAQLRVLSAVSAFHDANPLIAGIGQEDSAKDWTLVPRSSAGYSTPW